ncbi:MAG: Clp protease N-terminal domain-containing protein [Streptosporangiaceae bacterium]
MPKINVYLPDDLADAVKDAGIPVSAVCQRALEQAIRRVTAIREIAVSPGRDGPAGTSVVPFTARALRILQAALAAAAADGLSEIDGEHLLRALLDDRDSLAVRVLGALDITVPQLRAELDRRGPDAGGGMPLPAGPSSSLSGGLATVFELAANESSGLGHSYIGTEHLLLGLVGEPDGVAGHALRSLGADLRVTRRTVAAALAGYGAGFAAHAQRSVSPAATGQVAEITSAIRAELAPVLARIERLEGQLAG